MRKDGVSTGVQINGRLGKRIHKILNSYAF